MQDVPSAERALLPDPLPRHRLLAEPGIGGRVKVRPEDFIVDELPLYEPAGEGEHLYLRVQKAGTSHGELIKALQRHFGVRENAIGFAGMKDKIGITQQMVSIHLSPEESKAALERPLNHPRIAVIWADRHLNKLRRGHLVGNRFAIRIRDVDPMKAPAVRRVLLELERHGVPDYYGFQRFGYRRNNHVMGLHLLRENWQGLLDELLGGGGSAAPEHQHERRALYDRGRHEDALALWTRSDDAELAALKALVDGRSPRQAVMAMGRHTLGFWFSALQSFLFNRLLDERMQAGLFDRLIEGDLAWKHDRRRVFEVDAETLGDPDLARRLREVEVSPSGPLWGPGMMRPKGRPLDMERGILAASNIDESLFERGVSGFEGTRRPLRARVQNIELDSGVDEHGPYIRVAFDLPRGAYATVLLREVMGEVVDGVDTEPADPAVEVGTDG